MSYQIIGTYDLQQECQLDKPVYIYFLCERSDGKPRYVGQTVAPATRLMNHWTGIPCGRVAMAWVRKVKRSGGWIRLCVLEIVSRAEAREAEQQWILRLWADGADLLNGTLLTERGLSKTHWMRQKETELAQI